MNGCIIGLNMINKSKRPSTYGKNSKQDRSWTMDPRIFPATRNNMEQTTPLPQTLRPLCSDESSTMIYQNPPVTASEPHNSIIKSLSNSRTAKKQRLSLHSTTQTADQMTDSEKDCSIHDTGVISNNHDNGLSYPAGAEFDVPDSDEEDQRLQSKGISTLLGRSSSTLKPRRLGITNSSIAKSGGKDKQVTRLGHDRAHERHGAGSAISVPHTKVPRNNTGLSYNFTSPTTRSSNDTSLVAGSREPNRRGTSKNDLDVGAKRKELSMLSPKSASTSRESSKLLHYSRGLTISNKNQVSTPQSRRREEIADGRLENSRAFEDLQDSDHKASASVVEHNLLSCSLSPPKATKTETPRKRKLKDRLVATSAPLDKFDHFNDDYDELLENSFRLGSSLRNNRATVQGWENNLQDRISEEIDLINPSSAQAARGKITYGGQRSYLSEHKEDADTLLHAQITDYVEITPHTRRVLDVFSQKQGRASNTTGHSSDLADGEQENTLRTVHELKAAGQMRRSALESDALMDDLVQADNKSQKRGAIFRLARRLLDPSFRDIFVRNGLHDEFHAIVGSDLDQFGMFAIHLSAYSILKLSSVTDPVSVRLGKGLVQSCKEALDFEGPVLSAARDRRANLSKIHQSDLIDLCSESLKQEGQDPLEASRMTSRNMALKCLLIITKQLGQGTYVRQVTGTGLFASLVSIVVLNADREMESLSGMIDLTLSLSVLEAISFHELPGQNNEDDLPLDTLQAIGETLNLLVSDGLKKERTTADLTLRVCLNVTTSSRKNAKNIATPALIELLTGLVAKGFKDFEADAETQEPDAIIDRLVLCLGFLTNLTKELDENRQLFLRTHLDSLTCLDVLLDIFQRRHGAAATAITESESRINVTFGYIVTLICCLCLNSDVRRAVGQALQDPSLVTVRSDMAQFILFNRTIGSGSDNGQNTEAGQQSVFVDRMERVLRALTVACKN